MMPKVSAEMIAKLRKQTDASIADCQKALKQAKCDILKALQILAKNGAVIFTPEADKAEIEKQLGFSLRSAVMHRNYKALEKLFEKNADINYNEPDMVHPHGGTPLSVAANFGDLKMVKYLVEHGADVKIENTRGERPYTLAVAGKYTEIAAYLKAFESEELHSLDNKLKQLQKYELSDSLLAFLQGDKLKIKFSPNEFDLHEVEFYSLIDTVETKFHRKKLLLIARDIDGASCELVWNPKAKCVGFIDVEHDIYADVCSFEEFIMNPTLYIVKIVNGECEYDTK